MVQINGLCLIAVLGLGLVNAMPIERRINQIIADATHDWEQACLKAGGAGKCNPQSQASFITLLASGGNCDQQNQADNMIDLAKTLNSDSEMIRLTQLFVQQPRNAPDKLQVPYCQTASRNTELNGLFHCQFAGTIPNGFSGDQTGNVPLGLKSLSPAGSCPAKKDGPVPDGQQLEKLVSSPGVPGATGAATPPAAASTPPAAAAPPACGAPPPAAAAAAPPAAAPAGFTLSNGKAAQALNKKFASLTTSSSCAAGNNACIGGQFAQCVGGKFVTTGCAGGTQCFALPLVNSAGTSITCSTQDDALSRIANTGATGGLTG